MSLEKQFLNLDKKVQEILKKSTKTLTKNYKRTLEELRTTIRKLYDSYEIEGKLTLNEMSKYDRLQKLDNNIKTSLTKLYSENSALTKATLINICEITRDITIDTIQAKTVKSLIPIKKTLDIDATVNEKMAGLHWSERMGHHRNDVIYSVQKTLKEGLAQGSTYKQMSDRLKDELGGNVVKPMRIIRTEGARVYASTQQQSLNAIANTGLKMMKKWVSARDERVRDMHYKMDGVTIPYEDDFVLPDGVVTKMPHLTGYARHDIHCRCIITVDLAENQDVENPQKISYNNKGNEDNKPEKKPKKPKNTKEEQNKKGQKKVEKTKKSLSEKLSGKSVNNTHASNMNTLLQYTDFEVDNRPKILFGYSVDRDVLLYNPLHKSFNKVNFDYALIHELSHRADALHYKAYQNKEFLNAIKNSADIIKKNEKIINQWFKEGGKYREDIAFSDIISGISKGDKNNILKYGHPVQYWKTNAVVAKEVFANMSSIDLLDFESKKDLINMFPDLFNAYKGVVYG